MSHRNVQKVRSDKARKRPCMNRECKRVFLSTHNGHRFCDTCRSHRIEGMDTIYDTRVVL